MNESASIKFSSVLRWLRYHFLERKLNTGFGMVFLILISLILSYCIVAVDKKSGPVALSVFGAILLIILMMKRPYAGFYFLIAFSSVTITVDRLVTLPLPSGNLVELLTYFLLLSVLSKRELKLPDNRKFWINPISISFLMLFAWYLIEFFNPAMDSSIGWLSYFRKQLSYFVFYFICYRLINSESRVKEFLRFIMIVTTLLAVYACKQQWFGYAGFEQRAIGTGAGYSLLFQAGMLRKFSVFSDPATSGILFAAVAMLAVVLFCRTGDRRIKLRLVPIVFFNMLGYAYAGTRTATIMFVAGILLYGLATIYERRTVIFLSISAVAFSLLMIMPWQTSITERIRSSFDGTKDASAALRDFNRHQVQPYIQDHLMGGGIFTSGSEGTKYNTGHYLEYLQADSGYLKNLAEQGPIGLALLLCFYFTIMRVGFHQFYRVRNDQQRTYYIGLLVMMFMLMVAQYSQMAISQYPVVLYFYATLVIFIRLAEFIPDNPSGFTKEI